MYSCLCWQKSIPMNRDKLRLAAAGAVVVAGCQTLARPTGVSRAGLCVGSHGITHRRYQRSYPADVPGCELRSCPGGNPVLSLVEAWRNICPCPVRSEASDRNQGARRLYHTCPDRVKNPARVK
jgi:hypothetical protein